MNLGPLFFIALLCAISSVARADDKAADGAREPAGYRAAIDLAVQEHERSYFAEARENFARAHALFPNARTLRGLGFADFELRHYVDAVKELEAALAHETKRLEGALRSETEALLARAQAYVGEVQLALEPAITTVSVDGVTHAPGPQGLLLLEVGDHTLEFQAPGRASQQRTLRVQGQQRLALRVSLPLLAGAGAGASAAVAPPEASSERAAEPKRRRRRVVTWVLGGLTVVAVGAVVGTAVALQNTKESFEDCQAADGQCEHLGQQGKRLERTRNAMIGVASGLAVATLVTFFVEGRLGRSGHASLGVSPSGVRVSASF